MECACPAVLEPSEEARNTFFSKKKLNKGWGFQWSDISLAERTFFLLKNTELDKLFVSTINKAS